MTNQFTININYPTSADNSPRWGHGKPPHALLDKIIRKHYSRYQKNLKFFLSNKNEYLKINLHENLDKPTEPFLTSPWLPGLDSLVLYSFLKKYKPETYLEVGSGSSTKLARKSIHNNNLKTKIISVDPFPRSEIDLICDTIIRQPLESVNLEMFFKLKENDILFIDNSHRSFMNSDVTVFFMDILPNLHPGVIVQIHDITLPYDYSESWKNRYYNEQYLLAAYLLAGTKKFELLSPNAFISQNRDLLSILNPVFNNLKGVSRGGGSFWIKIKK